MGRIAELRTNLGYVWREEGLLAVAERLGFHAGKALGKMVSRRPRDESNDFVDVLFVNGCDYCVPHPIRYRVNHQAEQLEAIGMSTRIVNAWELSEDYLRVARTFIFFRCPYSDPVGRFIGLAHDMNKRVLYDIDDLVIDTVYTDQIKYVAGMPAGEKAGYDDGVRRMGKTMMLCDGAITTTNQLATELRKYVPTVFVNRNVASEEMRYFSERAIYERDTLPGLSGSEVSLRDRHRWRVARDRKASRSGFAIGYFSGSITHNDDFKLILPAVCRFMRDYPDVSLHVVGELDLPKELEPFSGRILRVPFSSWRHLPQMISFVDVNLIPLEDALFNRAKSENKWVEAGLVKVPSIASNVGALADSITSGVDGILCSNDPDEWYDALVSLRNDPALYSSVSRAAYEECFNHHVTIGTGMPLARFIRSQETPNLAFSFPGLDVSGGVLVALRHAAILRKRGTDVTLIAPGENDEDGWLETDGVRLPVILVKHAVLRGRFDRLVATMWTTLEFVKRYPDAERRLYLVQNKEDGFYKVGDPDRANAARTYGLNPRVEYCTISPWCHDWLCEEFGQAARYAPNGIDTALFAPCERDWSGRIRILIEGDSASEYKNVDESFKIVDMLSKDRFEIWYLSYKGKPKPSYRVDRFLHAVPHDEVAGIYQQCHILLKTSVLESFSYPPLEMMATGGCAVVLRNEGNACYLLDGENCLLFDRGEDSKAAGLIERIVADEGLRDHLRVGGLATANRLSWDSVEDSVAALYK